MFYYSQIVQQISSTYTQEISLSKLAQSYGSISGKHGDMDQAVWACALAGDIVLMFLGKTQCLSPTRHINGYQQTQCWE